MGKHLTAAEYLDYWRKRRVWTHLEWPKHRARLHWCADQCLGETFADVGCALGHSTAIMRERRPGRWTGIDFARGFGLEAARNFHSIDFHELESVAELPSIGEFDSVVCSEVLEHVPDDAALMAGLLRIARRRLIITTPSIDAKDPGHVRIYSRQTLRALVGEAARITKDETFWYVVLDKDGGPA